MASTGNSVPGVSRNVTEVFLLLRSNAQQDFAFRDRKGRNSKVRFGSLKGKWVCVGFFMDIILQKKK